jgi:hypothetical protein
MCVCVYVCMCLSAVCVSACVSHCWVCVCMCVCVSQFCVWVSACVSHCWVCLCVSAQWVCGCVSQCWVCESARCLCVCMCVCARSRCLCVCTRIMPQGLLLGFGNDGKGYGMGRLDRLYMFVVVRVGNHCSALHQAHHSPLFTASPDIPSPCLRPVTLAAHFHGSARFVCNFWQNFAFFSHQRSISGTYLIALRHVWAFCFNPENCRVWHVANAPLHCSGNIWTFDTTFTSQTMGKWISWLTVLKSELLVKAFG